jgi:hypothetical protein
MQLPLFFCLGFCIAIIYLDLVFDVSALPYRKAKSLPVDVLTPIVSYYRYVTKNPWLLIFVMSVVLLSIITEMRLFLAPRWVGYSSLVIFGLIALLSIARVIPGAQRLASGKESTEKQSKIAVGLFFYHLCFLILIILLILIQSSTVRS